MKNNFKTERPAPAPRIVEVCLAPEEKTAMNTNLALWDNWKNRGTTFRKFHG